MSYGFAADGLLAILLIVTIVYAFILNRKLTALRGASAEMQTLVRELAVVTQAAEGSLAGMKQTSQEVREGLRADVEAAEASRQSLRSLSDDLAFLIEKGSAVADRMSRTVQRKPGEAREPLRPVESAATKAETGDAGKPSLLKNLEAIR